MVGVSAPDGISEEPVSEKPPHVPFVVTTRPENAPAERVDVADGTGEPVTAPDAPPAESRPVSRRTRTRQLHPPLGSVAELIRAVYSSGGRRIAPRKRDIAAIRAAPSTQSIEGDESVTLAAGDRTLERTSDLLTLALALRDTPIIANQLRDFARVTMVRHPAFAAEPAANVLAAGSRAGVDEAVEAIALQDFSALRWGDSALGAKDGQRCRTAALSSLLLWLLGGRSIDLEQIQEYLHRYVWVTAARRHKTDAHKVRALVNVRDPAAAGLISALLGRQVRDLQELLTVTRAKAEALSKHSAEVEERLTGVSAQLSEAQVQIERMRETAREAEAAHQDALAHSRDRFETLRGRVLRRLNEEVSLLQDGLYALQRQPPKPHVMADHAERAISGLSSEIANLKERGDHV